MYSKYEISYLFKERGKDMILRLSGLPLKPRETNTEKVAKK